MLMWILPIQAQHGFYSIFLEMSKRGNNQFEIIFSQNMGFK